jgi:hypothetical protein
MRVCPWRVQERKAPRVMKDGVILVTSVSSQLSADSEISHLSRCAVSFALPPLLLSTFLSIYQKGFYLGK